MIEAALHKSKQNPKPWIIPPYSNSYHKGYIIGVIIAP